MGREQLDLEYLLPGGHEWGGAGFEHDDGVWIGRKMAVSYPDDGHDVLPETLDSWWYAERAKVVLDAARTHCRGSRVLWDVGGGTGLMAMAFRDAGWRTALVEPVEPAARKAVGVADAVFAGQLEDLCLPPGSVPAIGLFDVIEHLDDPIAMLQECRRVLAPDGIVIVTVPALPRLWSATDRVGGHKRRYTKREMAHEAQGAGLQCIQQSYFFGLLALAAMPSRLISRRAVTDASDAEILAREARLLSPSPAVNRLFRGICATERLVGKVVPIPAGLSLLAVLAHAPKDASDSGRGRQAHGNERGETA